MRWLLLAHNFRYVNDFLQVFDLRWRSASAACPVPGFGTDAPAGLPPFPGACVHECHVRSPAQARAGSVADGRLCSLPACGVQCRALFFMGGDGRLAWMVQRICIHDTATHVGCRRNATQLTRECLAGLGLPACGKAATSFASPSSAISISAVWPLQVCQMSKLARASCAMCPINRRQFCNVALHASASFS